jgi:hypothetical protein
MEGGAKGKGPGNEGVSIDQDRRQCTRRQHCFRHGRQGEPGRGRPEPRRTVARAVQRIEKPHSVFKGGTGSLGGTRPKELVAYVSGTPRDLAQARTVHRVMPTGGSSGPRSIIMNEINQQVLHSKYKFRENAPIQEYLRQKVPTFREEHTLYEILTMLKIIIRENLLFDKNNPSVIVGDPPLEAALGKKEIYMEEVRGIIYLQLGLTEACQGPLTANTITGGIAGLSGAAELPVRKVGCCQRNQVSRLGESLQESTGYLAAQL